MKQWIADRQHRNDTSPLVISDLWSHKATVSGVFQPAYTASGTFPAGFSPYPIETANAQHRPAQFYNVPASSSTPIPRYDTSLALHGQYPIADTYASSSATQYTVASNAMSYTQPTLTVDPADISRPYISGQQYYTGMERYNNRIGTGLLTDTFAIR